MSEIAISVRDVSKSFKLPHEKHSGLKQAIINFRPGKKYEMQKVLSGVSFEVEKGDFFGIVGRNGSGKSTLLKLLAQIYTPNSGAITVNGSLTPFIELGVGFNPELTGRENVFLNGALLGFDRKQVDEMYEDIVSFAELERFMDQKLKNYSSGMQVRLAFSIAIRAKSDILLLDEVLAVGDAAFQQKCYDYFEELRSGNKTVVFVSHDMSAVRRFCNKAIYLDSGKLVRVGPPSDIADIYVEENIEAQASPGEPGPKSSRAQSVSAQILDQSPGSVELKVSYASKEEDEMYVGLAVIKDGISIAEILSPQDKPLSGSGEITYKLNTTPFNPGAYRIDTALFRLRNRELTAVSKIKNNFVIKGGDLTRGAALKLEDTWEYK